MIHKNQKDDIWCRFRRILDQVKYQHEYEHKDIKEKIEHKKTQPKATASHRFSKNNNDAIWVRVKARLHHEIGDDFFKRYIYPLEFVDIQDTHIILQANRTLKTFINDSVLHNSSPISMRILSIWKQEDPKVQSIQYIKNTSKINTKSLNTPLLGESKDSFVQKPLLLNNLKKTFTFDSFFTDVSNQQAYQLCQHIGSHKVQTFSPCIIEGSVGIGKTHLLQATAWNMIKKGLGTVLYKTSEQFLISFLTALKNREVNRWREDYLGIDYFILDDIQFLSNKQSTLEELLYILNEFDTRNVFVLMASSLPVQTLPFPKRLLSRLQGGGIVSINYPTESLKYQVLQLKNNQLGLKLQDKTLKSLAQQFSGSIRELEGVLKKLYIQSIADPFFIQNVTESIKKILYPSQSNFGHISLLTIMNNCAIYYGFEKEDILSKKRTKKLALCRQMTIYMMRTMTTCSLIEIAKYFGKHHTTILHSVENITKNLDQNLNLRKDMNSIYSMIQEASNEIIH